MTKLVFIQLNEVNFDIVRQYLTRYSLPNFSRLLASFRTMETYAESSYAEIEPWIQWASVHTGKPFAEHRVFRLGDIVRTSYPQIFESLEARGLRVGALSPMNARNDLKHPAYFVPDPWTQTSHDGSSFSGRLTKMLRQTVNDNSQQRISKRSKLTLVEAMLRSFDRKGTFGLLKLIVSSPVKPWIKALVLDKLLHLLHRMYMRKTKPDVSFVFFNAGAHIQHHYFLSSEFADKSFSNPTWYVGPAEDPMLDMLKVYDDILGDYLDMVDCGMRLIIATGLTQVPYERIKFYYRLRDHEQFLHQLDVRFSCVLPRMTRDFEVVFENIEDTQTCRQVLEGLHMDKDGQPVFAEIEDRGMSLFVTLTYPNEIVPTDVVRGADGVMVHDFASLVSFVAIKNGMHSGKGFAFVSPGVPVKVPAVPVHVASLFDLTLEAVS